MLNAIKSLELFYISIIFPSFIISLTFNFQYRTKIRELDEKVANLEARLRETTPDIRSRINGYSSVSNYDALPHFSPTASLMSPLKTKRSDSISTDHNLNYEGTKNSNCIFRYSTYFIFVFCDIKVLCLKI